MESLVSKYPKAKEVFQQASDIMGLDTLTLTQNGPAEKLNQTTITQPLLLTAGVACYEAFISETGFKPTLMAGHSLGEYSALVAAGALTFQEALKLVIARAEAMQSAVPIGEGAMAAVIGLTDEQIIDWCAQNTSNEALVSPVNFNAPGQVVIAGHAHAVEKAIPALKEVGAKRVLALPVSVPSHCALMHPATQILKPKILKAPMTLPCVPVIQNVDASSHEDVERIKGALIEQLSSPVRWVSSMHSLAQHGVQAIFEMGPGQVLCGLQKRIDKTVKAFALGSPEGINEALHWLNEDD